MSIWFDLYVQLQHKQLKNNFKKTLYSSLFEIFNFFYLFPNSESLLLKYEPAMINQITGENLTREILLKAETNASLLL